jgi:diadenylate cyclase
MNQFFPIAEQVTLKDFVDIIVVSLIIYNVLIMIRGTRAVQMLVGLFAVLLLFLISGRYQLYSLNWILDNFFDSFFVIFIILFQDPIRNSLVSFGKTDWWNKRNRNRKELESAIEEVVEVISALSKEKKGALVVFERQNGLLNYISTGTRMNCEIHSDVLYSVFLNTSPLHDGAVIISRDKISAAGCFLPLSRNVEIDRHLGTRHRAALGVSEVSDAVVVIVSEETGSIKLCFNGIFYSMTDSIVLRRQLKLLLISDNFQGRSRKLKVNSGTSQR